MLLLDDKEPRPKKEERIENKTLDSLLSRINLDEDRYVNIEHQTAKQEKHKNKYTDKKNRATCEQVLDPRTKIILLKMIKNQVLSEINGCISTGKEANVYHAVPAPDESLALKIYKTSILTFKDRKIYVEGEFRFRTGYTGNNPRKMVRMWAEKEFKNLKLLQKHSLPGPRPLFLKQHVLGMTFVGDEKHGHAAPRLKDYSCSAEETAQLYRQTLVLMRRLYSECRLVHGDLSEYNLLVWNKTLYMIDLSQSVENDNMHALDFLRRDCKNILQYFQNRHIETLSSRQLFDFVTDIGVFVSSEEVLDTLHRNREAEPNDSVEESVFLGSYIPRTLWKVPDDPIDDEKEAGSYYSTVTGIVSAGTEKPQKQRQRTAVPDGLEQLEKKERKKLVKEQNRERRKQKAEEKKAQKGRNPTHKVKRK